MTPADAAPALVDRLFRSHAGRMVSYFTRLFGAAHLDLAEEVVQDALVKALQQWPFSGVPDNPGGWLFRVAYNDALDAIRRRGRFAAHVPAIARELADQRARTERSDGPTDDVLRDDELKMMCMCCHPALPRAARLALSLKTVCGFGVAEIAKALLTDERAVAQRLVRTKRQIRERGLALDLPTGRALARRTSSVLEVIYLLFNEGYGAHAGEDLVRVELCREAIRLGRLVADAPATATPRAYALVALMAFHAARIPARVDDAGELVLLEDQDRRTWDQDLLTLGFKYFEASIAGASMGPYHVQAAIASLHAAAVDAVSTNWRAILALYDDLLALDRSPIVRLNRAVALSKVKGPRAALAALAPLDRERSLRRYYLLPAVRAEFCMALGRRPAAERAYRDALRRPISEPERRFLVRRLRETT